MADQQVVEEAGSSIDKARREAHAYLANEDDCGECGFAKLSEQAAHFVEEFGEGYCEVCRCEEQEGSWMVELNLDSGGVVEASLNDPSVQDTSIIGADEVFDGTREELEDWLRDKGCTEAIIEGEAIGL